MMFAMSVGNIPGAPALYNRDVLRSVIGNTRGGLLIGVLFSELIILH